MNDEAVVTTVAQTVKASKGAIGEELPEMATRRVARMLPGRVEEGASFAAIRRKLLRKSARSKNLLHVSVSSGAHWDYYFGSYRKFGAAP